MNPQTDTIRDQAVLDIDDIRQQRGWFVVLGLLMTALGSAAIAFPFTASLAVTLTVGMVLLIAGAAQLVHALRVRKWRGFLVTLLGALLSLAVGTLVLIYPVSGVLSLTLLVGSFLLVGGTLKIILAFRVQPNLSWRWLLVAGCLAVLLGVLILLQWPFAAAWVLGVLVGIDLILSGWWLLALALAASRLEAAGEQHATLVDANAQRRAAR